ncbi:ParB/RepB/Spo0J family partition protein [Nocardia farcinica]|uniref:ParB/RepB/Spo0J family partition protein n=1 Tax=Nocardia farcinica TaxID=37329 RepID=UPI0037B3675E
MPAPERPKRPRSRPVAGGLPSTAHSDTAARVSAILAETASATIAAPELPETSAPLSAFAHRPDNPRWSREYDPQADPELEAFAATVEEYGILQAVTVCSTEAWLEHHPDDEFDAEVRYVVLMGNRRLAIARYKKIGQLPFHRNDRLADPRLSRESGIIENYHRKPLDPVREAGEMAAVLAHTGESRRAFAERIGISHSQVNQRLQLLDLIPEFQGLVSDLALPVHKALKVAVLPHADQAALLEMGPPFDPARLTDPTPPPEPESGKTLSTTRPVRIPPRSTPDDVVEQLRKQLDPQLLDEVVRLLTK